MRRRACRAGGRYACRAALPPRLRTHIIDAHTQRRPARGVGLTFRGNCAPDHFAVRVRAGSDRGRGRLRAAVTTAGGRGAPGRPDRCDPARRSGFRARPVARDGPRRQWQLPLAAQGHRRQQRREARLRLGIQARHSPRSRGDAGRRRRHALRVRQFRARLRSRCRHGRRAVALRPGDQRPVGTLRVLRCHQSRRRGVAGPCLRRHARWLPTRDRCGDGQAHLQGRHAARA